MLTLQAVGIEQVFALFVRLHPALCASDALSSETPEQALALKAVRRWSGRPDDKIVRRCAGNGVDERLQGLLVNVHFLHQQQTNRHDTSSFSSHYRKCSKFFSVSLKRDDVKMLFLFSLWRELFKARTERAFGSFKGLHVLPKAFVQSGGLHFQKILSVHT